MINNNQLPGIRYCNHNVDPANVKGDHILILRDPIKRFASAVRYAIQNYAREPQIKAIIDAGYTDPNDWAEAMANPDHPGHELVMKEVNNNRHRIGKRITKWMWIYTPQAEWFDRANPTHVLMMDNLDNEFNELMDTLGYPRIDVPKRNTTRKSKEGRQFSTKAMAFLRETYKRDFEIFEEYRFKRN